MKKWKVAWLVGGLAIFGLGISWIFKNQYGRNEKLGVVLPVPTIVERRLKIAVMADVHNDADELEKMLIKAKNSEVEMVIVAGDLTNKGEKSELFKIKAVLDESGLRYATIPGNHEYDLESYKNIFGKNYQSINFDEIRLILIDNSYWQGLDEKQKEWIEDEVEECQVLVCIAIMHKPLNNVLSSHVMGENNKKAAAEAIWLRDLLINSGVRQIEAGHLHYATSYELEGIRTDIVGAISRERNNQSPRYTELVISKNNIERKVVEEINDIGN